MDSRCLLRVILKITVIAATISFAQSSLTADTYVGRSNKLLTSKVRTTKVNSKIDIAGAVSINGDVEAGKSKSTMDPGTSKSKLNQNLKNMKGSFNSCGCGGDRCVKHGKCRIPGYNPICCNNKCKCVKATQRSIKEKTDETCGLCGDKSAISAKSPCRDTTLAEFNCWTKHKTVQASPGETIYQFAYFRK